MVAAGADAFIERDAVDMGAWDVKFTGRWYPPMVEVAPRGGLLDDADVPWPCGVGA